MNDDGNVIDLQKKFNLDTILERVAARPEPTMPKPRLEPEEDDASGLRDLPSLEEMQPLPEPGDPYKAYSRPEKRPVATLFVILADGSVRGFPYNDLYGPDLMPGDDAGKGRVIVMRFARFERVRLTGRNLAALHALLGHHRIIWVRVLPAGKIAAEANAPVITGVKIEEIER